MSLRPIPAVSIALVLAMLAGSMSAVAQDGLGGMLPYSPPPSADIADPIAIAADGLKAEVEDDLGEDAPLQKIVTQGCTTELHAAMHRWTLDWRKIETVAPGDTFAFVAGPGVSLAIVGDASIAEQAKKLSMLVAAMMEMQRRCGTPT